MIVFRLCKREYRNDLSGAGAEKFGGRWNNKGKAVVYCGETRALCTTEIAVHSPFGIIPDDHYLVHISIPDTIAIKTVTIATIGEDWNHFPPTETTKKIGDNFIKEGKYLVLKVPSATVQGEFNFLLNPHHVDMKKIKIEHTEPFTFDQRLFNR